MNPKYSLRAYARHLRIGHFPLSELMKGSRPLTAKMIKRLTSQLGLPPEKTHAFLWGKSDFVDLKEFQQLNIDQFHFISEWYYYPILELPKLKDFRPNIKWAAMRLGITTTEVRIALERLERLGLVEMKKEGSWKTLSKGFVTNYSDSATSAAKKKLQETYLKMAVDALHDVDFKERSHSGMTLAIQKDKLPEAKQLITRFRREICALLESDQGDNEEVYQLAVSLFPISKGKRSRK